MSTEATAGVTSEQVLEALKEVKDPEIPIDLVSLGMIYDVRVLVGGAVEVDMTLTSMGCPVHDLIVDDVRAAVEGVAGVTTATVNVVWDPPWDRSKLRELGLKYLPIVGVGV